MQKDIAAMPSEQTGLITAYLLDNNGSGKKISWDIISSWKPQDGVLWVHLDYTIVAARDWLFKKSGLKKSICRALTVDESRPRAIMNNDSVLLFLRGVNLNPGADPEDMVSVRIFADKNRIITTRKRRLLSIPDVERSIHKNQGPKTSAEFIAVLSERLTERMSDVVENISDGLDDLEDSADKDSIPDLRRSISDLRRQAIMIRRYLSPQRDAINRLMIDQSGFFSSLDLVLLREVGDKLQRYIEDLDSVRDRAAVIQEEVSTRLSEQINTRMYLLSMVAVVFLPLSFITGLLGINVGGIPGSQDKFAFWVVCGLLVILSMVLLLLFRRKKWI